MARKAQINGLADAGLLTQAQATEFGDDASKTLQASIGTGSAVADATGGATVDAEARAAVNALLAELRTLGIIAT